MLAGRQDFLDQFPRRADVQHVDPPGPLRRAGGRKPRFDATNVQVTAARIVCRAGRPVSQSSPLGRSMASFGAAAALSPSITASSGGLGSPRTPVPSRASTIQAAPARCSASRAGSCRLPKISSGTPALRRIWKLTPASPCNSSGSAHTSTRTV